MLSCALGKRTKRGESISDPRGLRQQAQTGGVGTFRCYMPSMNPKKISPRIHPDSLGSIVESIVGCKWSLIVLQMLREGVNRPGAMERAVPGLRVHFKT